MFSALAHKILILDGGMGTMIQRRHLTEADCKGERFRAHAQPLKGNHEVLVLTQPDLIRDIHRQYIEAGADILTTCSFCANEISQREYGLADIAPEMAFSAARLARETADLSGRRIFVAGSVGPTNTSLSLATDADDPAARPLAFDDLAHAFEAQIDALIEGGADILLIETVFDALNAKAALYALAKVRERRQKAVPVMVSAAPADVHGRLLSGQTLEAFIDAIAPFRPLSLGINCGSGAERMRHLVAQFDALLPQDIALSYHPNAGMPDDAGNYPANAEQFAEIVSEAACARHLNIVGGCCGTTPDHIRALSMRCAACQPRPVAETPLLRPHFSGLESVQLADGPAIIAERANVTGSRKFKRLIEQKQWDDAVSTARAQMQKGACMFDVCMDDALLDAPAVMREFLRRIAADPTVAQFPAVIDSSDFAVIQTGLRECQGRCLVNSISLKEGEDAFLQKAREIRNLGSAAIVMAFDEEGQADTTKRRVDILTRAVQMLIEKLGFRTCDIALDPNILAIGTGLEAHRTQALSFIEACHILRERFPGILTTGGLSNLSFAFRGRDDVRSAIHRAFLERANDDLSLVIANPDILRQDVPDDLKQLAHALVTNASEHALDDLLGWVQSHPLAKPGATLPKPAAPSSDTATDLREAFIGVITTGAPDAQAIQAVHALRKTHEPLQIIEGPLMAAMNDIGERFARGDLFLPQIVKAARLMKLCIQALGIADTPNASQHTRGRILLATVRGDVHDIGKNIVSIVLTCNGFEVIDLGVMVETAHIVQAAQTYRVDAIGLSGLISPSLNVMVEVAQALKTAHIRVPLFVGGAAANALHTALKIAPAYAPGIATYIADASRVPGVLARWLSPETRADTEAEILRAQRDVTAHQPQKAIPLRTLAQARAEAHPHPVPEALSYRLESLCTRGLLDLTIPAADLIHALDLEYLARTLYGSPHAPLDSLQRDIESFMNSHPGSLTTFARIRFMHARPHGDDISLLDDAGTVTAVLYGIRSQQQNLEPRALADFVDATRGVVGLFALTTPHESSLNTQDRANGFAPLLAQSLATALVESANQHVHSQLLAGLGPYILPAIGYPICPDHTLKTDVLRLLRASELGIQLTESQMMSPLATVCGFSIIHPDVVYYNPGLIGQDQRDDYTRRRNRA
ncbi:MAG: homocysteine S-methyltransferase family protein [Proteobacteria bacterium]|nr:homocysteine S-methyltransferase family protein [Pseudomonadota bacterium]